VSTIAPQDVPPFNRLLAALPKNEYMNLLPELTPVVLDFGEILYEPGDAIRHVYFPNNSVISLLSTAAERAPLEVGMVGNEGMTGLSVFMGIDKANTRGLVKAGGSAFRMKSATLRKISNHASSLHSILHRYTYSLLTQISQSSACSRFHTADARLARWLLMTSDGRNSNEVQMTQDFLSKLVGIRREAVSKAACALQKEQLINYKRGVITILNRPGLERVSCGCYAIIRESDGCELTTDQSQD
jgi:CRP-like cAMP-binding protein